MSAATPSAPCRVVVSYAREDEPHRRTFRKHVADIERGGVEFFDDRDIPVGVPWQPVLFGALERADIVVLLLTADYVASDFCMEEELGTAMRRWEAGGCRLFPIHVAPFVLTNGSPLGRLQRIPSEKPITGYGSAAAREWRRVTQELRKLIEDVQGAIGGRPAATPPVAGTAARHPQDTSATVTNNVIGNSVGTSTVIGEVRGTNVTFNLPQPPPASGPRGPRRSR
ncbi:toll/interleukin-1 receptor domain-containing protein [Streptomyces sp. B93]|uniref:toll/interleukin-1 receptor domain-containing protein n=1 Tax=Streptomyces sp. B93 TaxID=2824875 RepID=UPI001B36706A|nr:toll/interleukin-1 receptor domain-containing protein [Streptomyces sp. B93]MBQ1091707.1 toll/interleukin-1 receptor domain-containing protein [Streptomyces sp. B93]